MTVVVRPIILNYKGCADTIECLQSLEAQDGDFTCVPLVLDNDSGDGSVEEIRSRFPNIELIESKSNTGFCGGNNIAIRHALDSGCDYLFLLNNDTTLGPGCIQELLLTLRAAPDSGVAGPAIYYYDHPEAAWFTGSSLDIDAGHVVNDETDLGKAGITAPFEIPYMTGCAMLIPAAVIKAIGLFDERFFCYWEDTDLSVRMQRHGYRCLLCPAAHVYHKVSSTAKKQAYSHEYYMQRNRLLFVEKHASPANRSKMLLHEWIVILRYVKRFVARTLPVTVEFRVQLRALTDYTLRRFGKRTYSWK